MALERSEKRNYGMFPLFFFKFSCYILHHDQNQHLETGVYLIIELIVYHGEKSE